MSGNGNGATTNGSAPTGAPTGAPNGAPTGAPTGAVTGAPIANSLPSIVPTASQPEECKTVRYKKKDDGFTNVTVTNCAKSAAGGRKPASVSPSSKKATKKKCNGSIVYVGPRGGEYVKTTDGNFVRVPKINKNDENKTKSKPKANNKKVIKKSKKLKKENNKKKI